MNNKPVAWIEPITGNVLKDAEYRNNPFANETGDWIPFYTHPADLTDEEIIVCIGSLPKYNSEIVDEDLVKFARAILRKAQER